QPVDDCKTQAETIAAVRRTARELVELAEYTLPFVCRNAGPGIADIDAQLRPAVAATDHHPAALRVAHRIGYEIKHDALEQDGISQYPGCARYREQSQPLLARCFGEGVFDEAKQVFNGKRCGIWLEDSGLKLGHIEQRLEHLVHRAHRLVDARYQPIALRRVG